MEIIQWDDTKSYWKGCTLKTQYKILFRRLSFVINDKSIFERSITIKCLSKKRTIELICKRAIKNYFYINSINNCVSIFFEYIHNFICDWYSNYNTSFRMYSGIDNIIRNTLNKYFDEYENPNLHTFSEWLLSLETINNLNTEQNVTLDHDQIYIEKEGLKFEIDKFDNIFYTQVHELFGFVCNEYIINYLPNFKPVLFDNFTQNTQRFITRVYNIGCNFLRIWIEY